MLHREIHPAEDAIGKTGHGKDPAIEIVQLHPGRASVAIPGTDCNLGAGIARQEITHGYNIRGRKPVPRHERSEEAAPAVEKSDLPGQKRGHGRCRNHDLARGANPGAHLDAAGDLRRIGQELEFAHAILVEDLHDGVVFSRIAFADDQPGCKRHACRPG